METSLLQLDGTGAQERDWGCRQTFESHHVYVVVESMRVKGFPRKMCGVRIKEGQL